MRATPTVQALARAVSNRATTEKSPVMRPAWIGPPTLTRATADLPERGRRTMRIAFAADHAGAALKDELMRRLAGLDADHELIDLGGDGSDPHDDYPDFAERLGLA